MAITGTITIPERVINIQDVTCITINKENTVQFNYSNEEESGMVSCNFDEFWAALSTPFQAGIQALPEIIAGLSGKTISISGEF